MTSTTEPTAVLSIRVSHDLLRTLQGLATRHNRKASQIAAWLLEAGVADYYERRAKTGQCTSTTNQRTGDEWTRWRSDE